jgi:glyoxylase-like metal-dependent hydrolase (beta-lactamase superfamily II)
MKLARIAFVLSCLIAAGCLATDHPVQPATFGVVSNTSALLAVIDQPGPIKFETVESADWSVDRSGLINLDNPKAKAAQLKDQLEPIQLFFHVIEHPTKGLYIVDTGAERALRDDREHAGLSGFAAKVFGIDRMKVVLPLGDYLAQKKTPLAGVLLTHMHADHIAGVRDVPAGTPIYVGPHEATTRAFMNVFTQSLTDRIFEKQGPIHELAFRPDPNKRFEGVLDLLGDGSLWALWVPGHTPGSVAYLARTTQGPVLMTGDTCHTAWGWNNDVEPGSFTTDRKQNIVSLERLRRLAREHPAMAVRLGHQWLGSPAATVAR